MIRFPVFPVLQLFLLRVKQGNTETEVSILAQIAVFSKKTYYLMKRQTVVRIFKDAAASISQPMPNKAWLLRETPTKPKQRN